MNSTLNAFVGNLGLFSPMRRRPAFFLRMLLTSLVLFLTLGPIAIVGSAQSYQTALGVPPFATTLPVENGFVDASTGNLHLEIPLGSYTQRGLSPLKISLVYDSSIWVPVWAYGNRGILQMIPTPFGNGVAGDWSRPMTWGRIK
jgi:hypothetical protein